MTKKIANKKCAKKKAGKRRRKVLRRSGTAPLFAFFPFRGINGVKGIPPVNLTKKAKEMAIKVGKATKAISEVNEVELIRGISKAIRESAGKVKSLAQNESPDKTKNSIRKIKMFLWAVVFEVRSLSLNPTTLNLECENPKYNKMLLRVQGEFRKNKQLADKVAFVHQILSQLSEDDIEQINAFFPALSKVMLSFSGLLFSEEQLDMFAAWIRKQPLKVASSLNDLANIVDHAIRTHDPLAPSKVVSIKSAES